MSLVIMVEYCQKKLLEVSAFCPHTCAKTSTPLVNCIVNDGLVNTMPNIKKTLFQFTTLVQNSDKTVWYLQKKYLTDTGN